MSKKSTSLTIIIMLIAILLLSSCGTTNVLDAKVRTAIGGSSRSDEAVDWLITNKEIVLPELVNRVSNSSSRRSKQAAQALIEMGDVGRSGMIKLLDTMSVEGKNLWCETLSQEKSKQAVIELMIISTHEGCFESAASALLAMQEVSLNYLVGQLNNPNYQEIVDTVIANFGEQAISRIIPAVHSSNTDKVNRALVILATIGESAAQELAVDALHNSENSSDAVKIAEIMLKNYPDISIDAIMSAVSEDTNADIAAELLYAVSGQENIASVLSKSDLGNNEKSVEILKKYITLCGIDSVLNIAINGGESEYAGAQKALSGGEYDKETVIAILNTVTAADTQESKTYEMADKFVNDINLKLLAQAIISKDYATLAQLTSSELGISGMASVLSECEGNTEIFSRMEQANIALSGDDLLRFFTMLGTCSDSRLPNIALSAYSQGGQNGDIAAQALVQASTANGKFLFADIDMMPYAAKILEGISSSDETQKTYAQIILSRVSTSKSNNEFYKTIFESYKNKTIFSILAGHYGGAGALPVNLGVTFNGEQTVPETMSIKKTGDVKNVSSKNEPDYSSLLTGFAPYLGWSQVDEGADISIEFDCDITPRSKRYSGLLSSSYLGAEANGTLKVFVDGQQVMASTGYAIILPPDEYPGPSGEFRYMSDPENAPAAEVYVICFIDAMYNMWGEYALFGLYNYDVNSTNQVIDDIFTN